ncbi:MAG: Tad domain-containing protein, partial [Actinomycetota bacterium]|nr:Tad domain-containing protein [Actinomycetota bacterium]
MRRFRRRRSEEQGSVLILTCVLMSSVLIMSSLVLDVAQMRTTRRINKSVADMAVRAGLGVLNLGPWSGVCRAADFLRSSKEIPDFDPGSETWFQLSEPLRQLTSSPCFNPTLNVCLPHALGVPNTSTWGRLTATAFGGRVSIEIQSGYHMPDPRFPEDALVPADTGDPLKGECDNLSVIIRETHTPLFGNVFGAGDRTTTIRSVGRLSMMASEEYSPALLLLERHGCDVLTVNSNNSRVIAQPYLQYAGVIQIDSQNDVPDTCNSNQAVLNGASASGSPSVLACSARTVSPTPGCNVATGDNPSRIGIYALNFTHPAGNHVTSEYPQTYGDTQAVPGAQAGRQSLDWMYRRNVVALEAEAKTLLTSNGGLPPG